MNTTYTITHDGNITEQQLIDVLNDKTSYYWFSPSINALWNEHEEEMKSVSKCFPDIVFTLHSENGKHIYFKNGKMQKAEPHIVYDDFDPRKLK